MRHQHQSQQLRRLGCLPDHGEWLYASAANVAAATFAVATAADAGSCQRAGKRHVDHRLGLSVLLIIGRVRHRWLWQPCKQRALHDPRQPGALRNGDVLRDGELLRSHHDRNDAVQRHGWSCKRADDCGPDDDLVHGLLGYCRRLHDLRLDEPRRSTAAAFTTTAIAEAAAAAFAIPAWLR